MTTDNPEETSNQPAPPDPGLSWKGGKTTALHLERLTAGRDRTLEIGVSRLLGAAARSVAFLELTFDGGQRAHGTGFLIAPDLILTNHHNVVHEEYGDVQGVTANFDKEERFSGERTVRKGVIHSIRKNAAHDWAVIQLDSPVDRVPIALGTSSDINIADQIIIIQHPLGGFKRFALDALSLQYLDSDVIQYLADTQKGSSGSPVFNTQLHCIALHHAEREIEAEIDGQAQKIWRNEGIHIERVKDGLRKAGVSFNDNSEAYIVKLREQITAQAAPFDAASKRRALELQYLATVVEAANSFLNQGLDVNAEANGTNATPAATAIVDREYLAYKDQRSGWKDDQSGLKSIESFEALRADLRERKRIAIALIGEAGSGKTTTLRQLQRSLASSAQEQPEEPLPLFVPLGDFQGDIFDDFLARQLGVYDLNLADYLPDRLFLLLDGFNEMTDAATKRLQRWLQDHPGTPVIVTCRKLDYLSKYLPLDRVDIKPLDVEHIREFLRGRLPREDADNLFWTLAGKETADAWEWCKKKGHWSISTEDTSKEPSIFYKFWHGKINKAEAWENHKSQVKRVQDDLNNKKRLPGLLGIATNPFFLTAILNIRPADLPLDQNRGQLIAEFVDLLATQKARDKSPKSLFTKPNAKLRDELAELAYQMQFEHTPTTVTMEWVAARLPTIEEALQNAAGANILDVVPGERVRFSHQLLQEYYAAVKLGREIEAGAKPQEYWPGEKWWEPTGWEESAVILAGLDGDSTRVIRWLMPVQPTLAFHCATESGAPCEPEVKQGLYEPPDGARVSPEARAAWGRTLNEQKGGDKRPGVGLRADGLPDIDWCVVPEGVFLYGPSVRQQVLDIPAFHISRYPVTYLQFQAFVTANGYNDPTWWEGIPPSSRWEKPQRFLYANHPRDNVSWYEAIAFCRWLSDQLGREITLPTEHQWEKAARGTDGREWPWGGKEYRVGYANIDERDEKQPVGPTFLLSTTAVGMYPWGQSPYGVMDMCGNVWEWCLDDAGDEYGPWVGANVRKPLRGGSWNNYVGLAKTHRRYPLQPSERNWRLGFRVVALDRK